MSLTDLTGQSTGLPPSQLVFTPCSLIANNLAAWHGMHIVLLQVLSSELKHSILSILCPVNSTAVQFIVTQKYAVIYY